MVIGVGGYILILVLLVVGFFLGFIAGLHFMLQKIRYVCGYELYKEVLDMLHADVNKKEAN